MKVVELKQEMDEQFAELRREMKAEHDATRQQFVAVAEQMRSDHNVVIDKLVAVANDLARFQAGYATEHGNFARVLAEHDARLNALERQR